MTLPTIFPDGFDGTVLDFTKTQGVDRSGAARIQSGVVSIPVAQNPGTFIGLIPFNRGARFNIQNSSVNIDAIGSAGDTINLGYIYEDNTTYTNDVNAWVSASNVIELGGFLTVDNVAGLSFVAEADGWLAAEVLGVTTASAGNITFNIVQAYDS